MRDDFWFYCYVKLNKMVDVSVRLVHIIKKFVKCQLKSEKIDVFGN